MDTSHHVDILEVPATTAAVVRFHVEAEQIATIGEQMGQAFGTVMTELGKAHVNPEGPALACYEPTDGGFDVAAGFRVQADFTAPPGLERLDLGGVQAAHTTHLGSYDGLPSAYADLETGTGVLDRRLSVDGPMWEEYWSPPDTPDDQVRTEVFWPVAAART